MHLLDLKSKLEDIQAERGNIHVSELPADLLAAGSISTSLDHRLAAAGLNGRVVVTGEELTQLLEFRAEVLKLTASEQALVDQSTKDPGDATVVHVPEDAHMREAEQPETLQE